MVFDPTYPGGGNSTGCDSTSIFIGNSGSDPQLQPLTQNVFGSFHPRICAGRAVQENAGHEPSIA